MANQTTETTGTTTHGFATHVGRSGREIATKEHQMRKAHVVAADIRLAAIDGRDATKIILADRKDTIDAIHYCLTHPTQRVGFDFLLCHGAEGRDCICGLENVIEKILERDFT